MDGAIIKYSALPRRKWMARTPLLFTFFQRTAGLAGHSLRLPQQPRAFHECPEPGPRLPGQSHVPGQGAKGRGGPPVRSHDDFFFQQSTPFSLSTNKPALNPKHTISIKDTDTLTSAGKLDYAHQMGIKSLEIAIVQAPSPDNAFTAVCSASLVTEEGKILPI